MCFYLPSPPAPFSIFIPLNVLSIILPSQVEESKGGRTKGMMDRSPSFSSPCRCSPPQVRFPFLLLKKSVARFLVSGHLFAPLHPFPSDCYISSSAGISVLKVNREGSVINACSQLWFSPSVCSIRWAWPPSYESLCPLHLFPDRVSASVLTSCYFSVSIWLVFSQIWVMQAVLRNVPPNSFIIPYLSHSHPGSWPVTLDYTFGASTPSQTLF